MSQKDTFNKLAQCRHDAFENILLMTRAKVPVLMVGPSGSGKTSIARNVAEELGVKFYYTGSIESAFQVKGFIGSNGRVVRTQFREAYENGGLFLFDELDASDAQAVVALHAALDNGILDAPDGMIEKHPDFYLVAAANTWGHGASLQYMGRNALDGATLDRYAFEEVNYDPDFEKKLVNEIVGESYLSWVLITQKARQVAEELHMRHIVSTRAAVNGAKLLKQGMEQSEIFNRVVLKGMDIDQKTQFVEKMDGHVELLKKVDPSGIIAKLNEQLADLQDLVETSIVKGDEVTLARKKMLKINGELDKASTSNDALEKLSKDIENFKQQFDDLPADARPPKGDKIKRPQPRR